MNELPRPATGGRYRRDPDTGELIRIEEAAPAPAPASEPAQDAPATAGRKPNHAEGA